MYRKSNMETYTTMCKVDSKREFAVWLRQGLCVSLEGWDGEGGGKEYVYTYGWFMLRFNSGEHDSVDQLSFNRKF